MHLKIKIMHLKNLKIKTKHFTKLSPKSLKIGPKQAKMAPKRPIMPHFKLILVIFGPFHGALPSNCRGPLSPGRGM